MVTKPRRQRDHREKTNRISELLSHFPTRIIYRRGPPRPHVRGITNIQRALTGRMLPPREDLIEAEETRMREFNMCYGRDQIPLVFSPIVLHWGASRIGWRPVHRLGPLERESRGADRLHSRHGQMRHQTVRPIPPVQCLQCHL